MFWKKKRRVEDLSRDLDELRRVIVKLQPGGTELGLVEELRRQVVCGIDGHDFRLVKVEQNQPYSKKERIEHDMGVSLFGKPKPYEYY